MHYVLFCLAEKFWRFVDICCCYVGYYARCRELLTLFDSLKIIIMSVGVVHVHILILLRLLVVVVGLCVISDVIR